MHPIHNTGFGVDLFKYPPEAKAVFPLEILLVKNNTVHSSDININVHVWYIYTYIYHKIYACGSSETKNGH